MYQRFVTGMARFGKQYRTQARAQVSGTCRAFGDVRTTLRENETTLFEKSPKTSSLDQINENS